jgi:divalent metal cation (Fe/Co/Zn/Cd) transporter
MAHGEAHEIASGLEGAIRDELGADVEVDTHIEPMEIATLEGRDAGADETARVAAALARIAAADMAVTDVHDVRVRETPSGLVVHYHCRVDPTHSVAQVHVDVDKLDRRLMSEMKAVTRVVGHAEPRR